MEGAGRVRRLIRLLLRWSAHEHARAVGLYRRMCRPSGAEWARYLRRHGGFYAIGERCSIQCSVVVTDPCHVRLGNNVHLTGCTLFGHDGSVKMLSTMSGATLDRVGRIDIGDNVFVGHRAIIMPGVTIGSNVIVGAGALVTRDVPPNSIMVGCPARMIGQVDAYVARCETATARLPWAAHPGLAPYFLAPAPADLTALRNAVFYPEQA